MNILIHILLAIFFIILPSGEVSRIQLNNGISLSALDVIAGCIFIFVLFQSMLHKNYLRVPLIKPIALFIFVCFISLLVNIGSLTLFQLFVSFLYLVRWIAFASLYIFIIRLDNTVKTRIPYYIVISGFFFVISGFIQYFLYPNLKNLYYLGWDEHYLRLFSTFFDPNFAGTFLVLYFLFTLYILFKEFNSQKKFKNNILGVISFITCIAIFLTYSRSAFIALAFSLSLYLFSKGYKKLLYIFGSVLLLFILFVAFLTNVPTEGAHLLRVPSSKARIAYAENALTIIKEHPIFGVGFNTYRYAQFKHGFLAKESWESSHAAAGTDNSFLFILATTGVVGFLTYCFFLYRTVKFLLVQKSEFSILVLSSLIAVVTNSFFINSLFYTPLMAWMWVLLGLTENM